MYFVILPIKHDVMIAHTPNGMLANHIYFKLSEYAQQLPVVAASTSSSFTLLVLFKMVRVVRKGTTNSDNTTAGTPASTMDRMIHTGSRGVNVFIKTLW